MSVTTCFGTRSRVAPWGDFVAILLLLLKLQESGGHGEADGVSFSRTSTTF